MAIDWGAVAGTSAPTGVPSGGINWGGIGTTQPHIIRPRKPPQTQVIAGRYGVYGHTTPVHGGGSLIGNLIGQTESLVTGIPNAIASAPGIARHTLQMGYKTTGAPGWDPAGNIHEVLAELGIGHSRVHKVIDPTVPSAERGPGGFLTSQFWHDPRTLGGALYAGPAADVTALRRGDWHYFQQHPLNPILDIATAFSVGGAAALREARLGTLGEHAQTLATTERMLKDGDFETAINQSRTLQGRIRQRAYDRWSMGSGRDNPYFGAPARVKKILDRRVNTEMIRAHLPLRVFQRATNKLTAGELFAFHVAAEGVPLEDRIAYYKAREAEIMATLTKRAARRAKRSGPPKRIRTPLRIRPIQQYLANLESPEVRDALTNPRPEFIDALETGAKLEGEAGRRLLATDAITPETRQERALLARRVMEPPPPPPGTLGGRPLTPGLPPTPLPPLPEIPPTGALEGGRLGPTITEPPITEPPVPAGPEPVVGRQLGEEPPRGAPAPAPVEPTEPVTFRMKLPKLRYYEAQNAGLDVGEVTAKRGDLVTVKLTEEQMKTLRDFATRKGAGSAGAALRRRIDNQRHVFEDAFYKSNRRLPFALDPVTKGYYVPGSDYSILPAEDGYIALKGGNPLGEPQRQLADAKQVIERDAQYERNQARDAAAREATAAAGGDPFLSVIDQPGALTMATPRRAGEAIDWTPHGTPAEDLRTEIEDLRQKLDDAERGVGLGGKTGNAARKQVSTWRMQLTSKESRLSAMEKKQGVYAEAPAAPEVQEGDLYRYTRKQDGQVVEVTAKTLADAKRQVREKLGVRTLKREFGTIEKAEHPITEVPPEHPPPPAVPVHEPHPIEAINPNVTEPQLTPRTEIPPPAPPGGTAHGYEPFGGTHEYTLPERSAAEVAAVGPNPIHPAFPAPFRFPHVREGVTPGQFMAQKTESALGKNPELKQLRYNAAKLLSSALFLTHPERVLARDFLSTMRHLMIGKMQESLDKVAFEPSLDLKHSGFKRPEDYYYRSSEDYTTTVSLPKGVNWEQMLTQDRALLSSEAGDATLEKAARGIVSKDLSDFGITDHHDLHTLEEMKRRGIKVVHASYGKDFRSEFMGTPKAIRYFVDRPLDMWRALTLNLRPAWAVNNFVGNGLMGLATYGPEGLAAYLRVVGTLERGDDKIRTIRKWTFSHPTLRRKYGHLFYDVAPELKSAGLFGTQTKKTHLGYHAEAYANLLGKLNKPGLRQVGLAANAVANGVAAVGRGVTKAEILFAEDTAREASFLVEAGGDLNKIRDFAAKAGEGNISLAEALKRMDQRSVERAVTRINDVLGDFNDLSRNERAVIRRVIPFYSWYKVITKISAKFAARYPARLLLLKNIEDAQNRAGEPALPDWLRGSILLGSPSKAGTQSLISTQGLNPYQTIPQTLASGPLGMVSPQIQALFYGAGVNPAFGVTGQGYYGPGEKVKNPWLGFFARAAGGTAVNLAQFRLYSQTTQPYTGKLYQPHTYAKVGPVSVNDYLLQYLGLPLRHVRLAEARREAGLK